jgi:DNA-binding NtrC family response regulator
MDTLSQLTSTSVLVIAPDSSRNAALRAALSDKVGSVSFCSECPASLREIGPANSVVSTVVLSTDPIDTYPTSLVRSIRNRWPWVSVLLVDAPDSIQMATSAMRAGAVDYLVQDQSTVENISEAVLNSLKRPWRTQIGSVLYTRSGSEGKFVGSSDTIQPMLRRLGIAIENDLNVLLHGEPGTGKTLTARAIHAHSSREGAPLMQVDCRTLEPERARDLFLASPPPAALQDLTGGTLVLDHVNELTSEAQDVLAHALDTHDCEAAGPIQFIGVVSSPLPLDDLRADLYHELAELPIFLPPLRERADDILPLARHFLRKHDDSVPDSPFSDAAASALRDFSWPGNVRQLENVVKRSVRVSSSYPLEREDLLLSERPSQKKQEGSYPPKPTSSRKSDHAPPFPSKEDARPDTPFVNVSAPSNLNGITFGDTEQNIPSLEELKKQAVKRAYELFEGDVERAAVALDIGRSTMYRMIKRHNLRDDDS